MESSSTLSYCKELIRRSIIILLHTVRALFLGFLLSATFLQEDAWFKARMKQTIQKLMSAIIKTDVTCDIQSINLLQGTIELSSVSCGSAKNQKWSFNCPTIAIHYSWLGILVRSCLEVSLTFYDVQAFSYIEDSHIALIDPLKMLLEAPSVIPFMLKSCALRQSCIQVQEINNTFNGTVIFSSDSYMQDRDFKTNINITDGVVQWHANDVAQHIKGELSVDVDSMHLPSAKTAVHLTGIVPLFGALNRYYSLEALLENDNAIFDLSNADKSIAIKSPCCTIKNNQFRADIQAHKPLKLISAFVPNFKNDAITGTLQANGTITADNKTIDYTGTARAQDASCAGIPIEKIAITASGTTQKISGSVSIDYNERIGFQGAWDYTIPTQAWFADFKPKNDLTIGSYFLIPMQDFNCRIQGTGSKKVSTAYTIVGKDKALEKAHELHGTILYSGSAITAQGTLNKNPYKITYDRAKYNITCNHTNQAGKHLVKLATTSDGSCNGTIDYALIKDCIAYATGYELPGKAQIYVKAKVIPEGISVDVSTKNAQIRLPHTYNILTAAQASCVLDYTGKSIVLKDVIMQLYKGSITSSQTTLLFDNYRLAYIHAPVQIHSCLINWQKEFFGALSGNVTTQYVPSGKSNITGELMLEQSHLKGNLLSAQAPKTMLADTVQGLKQKHDSVELDIRLRTNVPLQVKTPFLEALAHVSVQLQGTLSQPLLSGIVELGQGSLAFPYKPLYITQAKIYLSPDQLDDPRIELIAKNTIKKYAITLSVTGSMQHPHIAFESSPTLQEEHILTLLLAGSHEGSLSLAMPHVLMQSLQNLLFGPADSYSKWQRYIKTLLKPLKNVRIIPSLTTQGTNGLAGGIEIDINDRVRALIQNNLSLSQAPHVEVEYALSDDVNIRGTKDEQGNVSGELEMRWKF